MFYKAAKYAGLAITILTLSIKAGGAAPIVYNMNWTVGNDTAEGTITTDGTIGTINSSNITSWDIKLKSPYTNIELTNLNSQELMLGSDLSATAKDLIYNFSGPESKGYLDFTSAGSTGSQFISFQLDNNPYGYIPGIAINPGANNSASLQSLYLSGTQVIAQAAATVPEPATLPLLGTCFVGLLLAFRRKPVQQQPQ